MEQSRFIELSKFIALTASQVAECEKKEFSLDFDIAILPHSGYERDENGSVTTAIKHTVIVDPSPNEFSSRIKFSIKL
jgi:hypothetical protein